MSDEKPMEEAERDPDVDWEVVEEIKRRQNQVTSSTGPSKGVVAVVFVSFFILLAVFLSIIL